jgi:succinyl-CoA synthetase beta subunit
VRKVLIDPAADIRSEIYLGIVIDRASRRAVLMASAAGGMDIEEVAHTAPEKIVRVPLDPFLGLPEYLARDVAVAIGLPREYWAQFAAIARGLAAAFLATDASLAEINPLAMVADKDGKITLMGLDGKLVIDDNAMFRHPDLEAQRDPDEETAAEKEARETGINFISLDGDIGCMVNGAGLAMATMDLIQLEGGTPANFLDVGGGATPETVAQGFKIILLDPNVKAVLINIFGGIVRCDVIAEGIIQAVKEVGVKVPVIVRLEGTNAELGRTLLAESGLAILAAESLTHAAKLAVEEAV